MEINRLLDIGAIKPCEHEQEEFISNIFTRPKPDGRIRVILNLRKLNESLIYEHFKLEHIEFATQLVFQNDFLCSIDLTDAYFSIPIHDSCWKYLKFYWRDQLYHYQVLVFGLSVAPRLFTRVCKPILALIRGSLGVKCSMYLDDMVLVHSSAELLKKQCEQVKELIENLGFKVNLEKSSLVPQKTIKHLGFIVDSSTLSLKLPKEKCLEVESRAKKILKLQLVSIRDVASFIGYLIAAAPATKWGAIFIRQIEQEKIAALKSSKGNFDCFMQLSEKAKDNVRWWLNEEKYVPRFFGQHTRKCELFSDASGRGWGGHDGLISVGGRWTVEEQQNSINWLEMKASFLVLRLLAKDFRNCTVVINSDNTCTVGYIQKQGGLVRELNNLCKEIWLWCKERNIWLLAKHVPGLENQIADIKSRKFNDNIEWSLKGDVFDHIVEKWGLPDIDLFASRLNHKVDVYMAYDKDPHCLAVDALNSSWSEFKLCYAFPPFSLIGRVLNKCIHDKAELLIIVPNWTTQSWYPLLKQIMVVDPWFLPQSPHTIGLDYDKKAIHPIWFRLNLMCCRISGR